MVTFRLVGLAPTSPHMGLGRYSLFLYSLLIKFGRTSVILYKKQLRIKMKLFVAFYSV
jgi:hypothetical protein